MHDPNTLKHSAMRPSRSGGRARSGFAPLLDDLPERAGCEPDEIQRDHDASGDHESALEIVIDVHGFPPSAPSS